jgi:hypothetical protein
MRVLLAVLLCCLAGVAAAFDTTSPVPPVYTSPDGNTRVAVITLDRDGQPQLPGQLPSTGWQALAEVQQRNGGEWRLVRRFPFVNDLEPRELLVANGARRIVAIDTLYGMGDGPNVVVIYDGEGHRIRSLGLADFLPPAWIRALPSSIGDIYWGRGHTLDAAGTVLTLQVTRAGESDPDTAATVPLRISVEDGHVFAQDAAMPTAQAPLDAVDAQRRAEWAKVRTARMQPLSAPRSQNPQAWRRYTVELAGRLSDDGDSVGWWQLTMLDDSAASDAESIREKIRDMAEPGFGTPDQVLLAAADPRRLAQTIAGALQSVPPASLRGDTIVFVGTREALGLVEPAAARSGATLRFVDATLPYPGRVEPEDVPDWFDGARN